MASKKGKLVTRSRIVFPMETEAASFVLREFIDPLNCLEKCGKDVFPMNKKRLLRHVYSKTRLVKPTPFSKWRLHAHLSGSRIFYYRSKRCARHQIGFGSTDKHAKRLLFADILDVKGKRQWYTEYYVMLLGIDIDCHHGEPDVMEVQTWLIKEYFPETYWEASSGGKGRHGYLKLAYSDYLDLDYVKSVLEQVFTLLNAKRKRLGFQSPIDIPCGMPSTLSFHPEKQLTESQMEELKDRVLHPSKYMDSSSVSASSKPQPHPEEAIDLPFSLRQAQGFKFPRFNGTHGKCHLDDIVRFHKLRYYKFSFFEELLKRLTKELAEDQNTGIEEKPSQTGESSETRCVDGTDTRKGEDRREDEEFSRERENVDERRGGGSDVRIIVRSPQGGRMTYEERITECKGISDKLEKTRKFYWAYALLLGKVPEVEKAIAEYLRQGLNANPALESANRTHRFEAVRKYILNIFDRDKLGIRYDDWEKEKDFLIQQLQPRIVGVDMTWAKGKDKTYALAVEDLALTYYAIRKSNQADDRRKANGSYYASSYDQIRKIFQLMKKGCHRAKVAKMLKILLQIGMIQKTAKYIKGERGNCYAVVEPLSRAG